MERQQATLRALMSTHTEKLARLKQQDRLYVPVALMQCPSAKHAAEHKISCRSFVFFTHRTKARVRCKLKQAFWWLIFFSQILSGYVVGYQSRKTSTSSFGASGSSPFSPSHPHASFCCRERRNLLSTLAAERKKVILYCRREAIKRRTKDIAASAKEARKMNANK